MPPVLLLSSRVCRCLDPHLRSARRVKNFLIRTAPGQIPATIRWTGEALPCFVGAMTASDEATRIIEHLGLEPHPEGGWFRETFRDQDRDDSARGTRACSTAIYFLLKQGEASHWHKVDSAETWHFYRGAPLRLSIAEGARAPVHRILGNDLGQGQHPQLVVPRFAWQAARSLGAYTLVGCTVAPGFEFSGFELAPPGFEPGK